MNRQVNPGMMRVNVDVECIAQWKGKNHQTTGKILYDYRPNDRVLFILTHSLFRVISPHTLYLLF